MKNQEHRRWAWIAAYVILNIAAVVMWATWYSSRWKPASQPSPPSGVAIVPTDQHEEQTPIFSLVHNITSIVCGQAMAMEPRKKQQQPFPALPLEISLLNEQGKMVDQSEGNL